MNKKFAAIFFFVGVLIFLPPVKAQTSLDSMLATGYASYYHSGLHGMETSNGERYDKNDFTAAHRSIPFNTFLIVTNKRNNKSVIVRVNDRGPFKRKRIIDLSKAAAMKTGMIHYGVAPVKIKVITFLDKFSLTDAMMKENEMLNCCGRRNVLHDTTVFVWQTDDIKHAFYMASALVFDYKTDEVMLQATGDLAHRNYSLFITGIKAKVETEKLIAILKSDGFRFAKVYHSKKLE